MDYRFSGSEDNSEFDVHRLLGDRLPRTTKWLRLSEDERTDTRRTATLLTVEDGVAGLALPRARAKAKYAIAVWVTLSPPEGLQLIPDVGVWAPQPHLQVRQRYKLHEEGAWISHERVQGGSIFEWGDYPAPSDDFLRMPFEALAQSDRRAAQALLSSSLALLHASRGSRLELSEQLRALQSAIESLCEPGPGGSGAHDRWERVAARLRVWDELASRGYEDADIEAIQERLNDARNVATHGADAVLLDLGYPLGPDRPLRRRRSARAEDLGFAALHADLAPVRSAVRFVLSKLWQRAQAYQWDDADFEKEFS